MKKIFLNSRKPELKLFTLVDDKDFEKINSHKWHLIKGKSHKLGYAVSKINGKNVYMHRFIINPPKNKEVDHINIDSLDNRRSNLRICTKRENQSNTAILSSNTTGYKGVGYRAYCNLYRATIMINRKQKALGYFKTAREAATAYNNAAKELFGEFARLNTI
jgi:hypothetical protein